MTTKDAIPFIKLIKTPNRFYFYDVNRNEIVPVEETSYAYLKEILEGWQKIPVPFQIEDLQKKGYLSHGKVKTIEHPMNDILPIILQRRMQKITLQLTQDCNFRCKYCHYTANDGSQRVHSKKKMSFEMVKKGILFLREHSVDSPEVFIGFYGGEPLLEFELLKKAVLYAEEVFYGKKINYTVTTNSTLFSGAIIEFFEQYDIQVIVSLDGPKEIHDKNRVFPNGEGTFDSVINKIRDIRSRYPKFFRSISFNMVIDPQNDYGKIDELFQQYPYLKKIDMSATVIDDISINKNVYSEEYTSKVAYKEFLAYLCILGRTSPKKLDPVTRNKVTGIRKTVSEFYARNGFSQKAAPGGPCVPGEVRLMLTVEGNFIVCERVNEISDCMILGTIEKGLDINKAKALLNIAQITQDICRDCWAFWGCDLCAKYSEEHGVLSREQRLSQCGRSRSQFQQNIYEKILVEEAQEIYGQVVSI